MEKSSSSGLSTKNTPTRAPSAMDIDEPQQDNKRKQKKPRTKRQIEEGEDLEESHAPENKRKKTKENLEESAKNRSSESSTNSQTPKKFIELCNVELSDELKIASEPKVGKLLEFFTETEFSTGTLESALNFRDIIRLFKMR
jgi:hemolysin activation/secretion protein